MTQQTLSELKIELGAMRQKLAELEARQDNATPAHTTRRRAFPKGGRFGLLPWVAGIAMITGLAYAAGEALFVDASGNVGIGTTQPQAQLDVVGEIKATGSLGAVSFVARNDPKLIWQWSAVDRTATLRMFGGSGSKVVLPGTVTASKFEGDGITAGGRVGIGTDTPSTKLHVLGGSDAGLNANSGYLVLGPTTSSNIVIDDNEIIARKNGVAADLHLQAAGGKLLINYQNKGGNVGIGMVNPMVKLDVNGPVMQRLDLIKVNNRGDWSAQNHPVMIYFRDKLRGKPVGSYIKAITDHHAWHGHYWQGWVDERGKIRVIHNRYNTTHVVN